MGFLSLKKPKNKEVGRIGGRDGIHRDTHRLKKTRAYVHGESRSRGGACAT